MALASAITSIASSVVGIPFAIAGSVLEYEQGKANAQMQEDQMNYNKRLAQREAAIQEDETREAARRQRANDEVLRARQRAVLGKSGAAMTAGSPLALLGETARNQELGIQDTMRTGYQKAQQSREQAKMFGYQARVARAQAPSEAMLALQIHSTLAGAGKEIAGSLGTYANSKTK